MCKKKKNNEITRGLLKFAFDIDNEMIIYKNLSFYNLKRKEKKKLEKHMKFNTYEAWKSYIVEKYSMHSVEYLKEFKRYLNHKLRRSNSFKSYWGLFIPVFLTLIFTEFTKLYIEAMSTDFSLGINLLLDLIIMFLFYIFVTTIIFGAMFLLVKVIVMPSLDNEIQNNLLIDYMEIVNEIIDKKTVQKGKIDDTNI